MFSIKGLIDSYERVTILSHINPDADTIGTALGIYTILKAYGKPVEVANADTNIPKNLDFLPHFSKIKNRIDYDDGLIIACDSGSIDRLGFDLEGRDILNIDHHKSNTHYGMINVVKPLAVSASQVAFALFRDAFVLDKHSVTCFYTALVSDTQYFTTNSVNKEVFDVVSDMIAYGIELSEVAYNLNQRKSLSSLRILSSVLSSLDLHCDGELSSMVVSKEKIKETGAKQSDFVGIVEHGLSLATVKIAIVLMELDGVVRVSMRSKKIDISTLAIEYGGGGHKNAAGFELKIESAEILLKDLINKIKKMGLLNETNKKYIQ